jgi:2-polyprenyl-3-methyl-5-hydroxy-6-metoxy-1,4-benzoquinol methylase
MEPPILTLQTSIAAEQLQDRLRSWEPWRVRIDFSNGLSTKDFKRCIHFNQRPLRNFHVVEAAIPFAELSGSRILDIGCYVGYNSIYAATKYRLSCTSIDVVPKHLEISQFFSNLVAADTQFYMASAESFSRPEAFNVVLHFGTLYHLPNPVLSLRTTFDNLRPGGYLALETQVYDRSEDPNICYFMHLHNNDETNFWALSSSVLIKCLELVGFQNIRELYRVTPVDRLGQHIARIIVVARKPEGPSVRPYPLQEINETPFTSRIQGSSLPLRS